MLTWCQKRFMINYAIARASPFVHACVHTCSHPAWRFFPDAEIDLCACCWCGIDQFTLKFPYEVPHNKSDPDL